MKLRATALLALCVAGSACGDDASVEEGPRAPSGTALWARQFGNSTELDSIDLAVDGAGNVLVAGRFFATADFGAGPVTSPANNWQAFVAKYDAAGALLWVKSFGDVYEERATHVGVDAAGNVYLGGEFRGTVDFGGGVLESEGFGPDLFVAKLAPDGSHLWSKRFGVNASEALQAMEVEPAGSIALLGSAGDGTDFGTGPMTFEGSPFLAKLETSGEAAFVMPFAGLVADKTSYAYPTAFAFGADGMAIALMSYDDVGNMQVGVRRIGPGGEPRWQRDLASGGGSGVGSVALRDDGAVFLAGELWSFLDFGNGVSVSPLATDSGAAFLGKLAADGVPEWAHVLSPEAAVNVDGIEFQGSIAPRAIAAASDGVIMTGGFMGAVDFGGGPRLSASMSDSIGVDYYYSPVDDVFAARFDDGGNHLWDAPFGNRARQGATSAGVDPSGDVFIAGSGQLDASGYYQGFVVKLAR